MNLTAGMKAFKGLILYILISIFNGFLFLLEKCDRKRIIKDRVDNDDYLIRYYLFLKNRKIFPFNIFLHKFLKSDTEDLHDHPWAFTTIILWGGYWEYRPNLPKTWYGPGSIVTHKATDFHRIELDPDIPDTWTLFIPGRRCRGWGFKTENGWIDEKTYLEDKKQN
jgi:hypothetical protein